MKKIQSSLKATVCMAAVALAAIGCSQDEWAEQSAPKGNTTIVASFEGADTRTSVNSENNVVWNQNDAFGLFYTTQSKTTTPAVSLFTCSNADGTSTTAAFSGNLDTGAATSYAVYPYQESMILNGSTVTMNLLASFDYTTASNGPMYAPASDITKSISFKHLAGLLKLTVSSNIATDTKKFVITADKNIAGTCTADLSKEAPELAVTSNKDASKTITVNLSFNAEQTTPTTFYIPIPTGTYSTLKAELQDNSGTALFPAKEWSNITVARASMLTSSFGFIKIDATTPSDITNKIAEALPKQEPTEPVTTNVELSGAISNETSGSSSAIELPIVRNSNVNLSLATLPTATSAIELKDKITTETTPTTAVNTVSIAIPKVGENETAPSFTITMPKTTVVLDANSTDGTTTYNEVTATTANNTLVIEAGVTVKKLIVKGGNVRVKGKIETIEKAKELTSTVYIIKETTAQLPKYTTGFEVIDAALYDMKTAFANGKDYVLTADVNIIGQNIVVPAGKATTLDLNGHTITASNKNEVVDGITVKGSFTLKDSKGNGKIVADHDYSSDYSTTLIYITGENAHMTMESGYINAARPADPTNKGQYGVGVYDGGDFTMTGGKIDAGYFALSGYGTYKTQNSIINITGGELISTADYAIYLPQAGTTIISGNTAISGACGGIGMRNGSLEIKDNVLITSDGNGSTGDWKDGTGNTGNAVISIGNGNANTYGDCKITINGGTFTAKGNATVIAKRPTEAKNKIDINISGGTFSDPSAINYAATNADIKIELNKNVDVEQGNHYILNAEGATATVKLNNHNIVNSTETVDEKGYGHTNIFLVNNGILNISGSGNVKCDASKTEKEDGYRIAVQAQGSGTVNIQGGSYYNTQKKNTQIDLIYAIDNGKINIYGGQFESAKYGTPDDEENGRYWVLNVHNGSKETADIKVYGGTFINFNPSKPNMDDKEPYTADGYEVTRDNEVYTQAHKVTDGRKEYIVRKIAQ